MKFLFPLLAVVGRNKSTLNPLPQRVRAGGGGDLFVLQGEEGEGQVMLKFAWSSDMEPVRMASSIELGTVGFAN